MYLSEKLGNFAEISYYTTLKTHREMKAIANTVHNICRLAVDCNLQQDHR